MSGEVSVELYDAGFHRLGWLNDAELSATFRHNRRSVATITVPADHLRAAQLVEPGRRVVITYTPDGGMPQVMSGWIGTFQTQGPRGSSSLVLTVLGDWLDRALAWPVPAAALSAQSSAYYTATGPAETVLKSLITANMITRLGWPITVATNLGRGSTVSLSARMVPLSDVVEPAADLGGIGIRVAQQPGASTIGVDAYVGADRTNRVLSESSGAVVAWSLTGNAPSATRAVIGMDGEGDLRNFTSAVDAAAESDWWPSETFVDARDLDDGTSGGQRGEDKLAELAATVSVSVTLAETPSWTFGRTVFLGDMVTVEVLPGVTRVERVREAQLTYTAADGLVVQPVVGDPDATEPERAQAKAIRSIAAAVRSLRAR